MNSSIRFLVFAAIPIVVALCFHPLWVLSKEARGAITMLTYIMDFLVTPSFLVFIIWWFGVTKKVSLLLCIPLCILVNASSIAIQYWNWGSSTGRLLSPDSTTVMITQLKLLISTAILLLGSLIIATVKQRVK